MIVEASTNAMLLAVVVCLAAAASAPWLLRWGSARGGMLLAAVPLVLLAVLLGLHGADARDGAVLESLPWIPGLDVAADFRLDGLSLLMTTLVLGIGVMVVAYSSRYMPDEARTGRFFAYLMAFMAAMLGLVLADNLLLLFVFWELTSLTSFLLIGFDHEAEKSRRAALQGLIVTVAGGLVMLAGMVVLAEAAGSYRISDIIATPALHEAPGAGLALGLIVMGCFTKSAQFPFHFWLPNAMAAPSPVSAYLHSATMVKAGVYLLARLHPALGEHAHWFWWLAPVGAVTMVLGAVMAFRSSGIKRVLAYTTVMALGTLTLLLGLGAAAAAMTFLLVHALYKGALFLVAGIIDHEAGAKDIREASGLARALPVTAAFAAIAAVSAAGVPPLFGFIGKELLLEYGLKSSAAFGVAGAVAGALVAAMVATLVLRVFFLGERRAPMQHIHEAPWPMLLGPVVLGIGSVLFGLLPGIPEALVLQSAAAAVAPGTEMHLALWHGFNLPLLLSALSLAAAVGLFLAWPRWQAGFAAWALPERRGPEAGYDGLMAGIDRFSDRLTGRIQSGYLRAYVRTIMAVVLLLTGLTLILRTDAGLAAAPFLMPGVIPALIGVVVVMAARAALEARSALVAVMALGALGFGIALLYVWFSAPDLAITQVLIETLTTILLMLVIFRMPRFKRLSSRAARLRDGAVAVAFGVLVTCLLWMVTGNREFDSISAWLLEHSVPDGHGRNVVNVILVDFRAFDTLGEIFVLALAAVGVYALLRERGSGKRDGGFAA